MGDKPQDHVLKGAEAAGQPDRVLRGGTAPVGVSGQALCDQGAVAAHQTESAPPTAFLGDSVCPCTAE